MRAGDPICFVPDAWVHGQGAETVLKRTAHVKGRVIYVHPKGRFYVAEGEVGGRTIREAYQILPKT